MAINIEQRQNQISALIYETGFKDAKSLSEELGVSIATVRRDLNILSEKGVIEKKHGGAIPAAGSSADDNAAASKQYDAVSPLKAKLATKAAELIKPGDIIFLGAGYTCLYTAKNIRNTPNLTVITNNFNIVSELEGCSNIKLVFCGGDVCMENNQSFTIGQFAINNLKNMYIQKIFITVNGVSLEHGLSINNHLLLDIYMMLHKNANETIILADSTKFDQRAFSFFCPLQAVNALVTDEGVPERYLKYCQENDILVEIAHS